MIAPMGDSRSANQADGLADTAEAGVVLRRRAGAPHANRNAFKHGRFSAAARAERAAARERVLRRFAPLEAGKANESSGLRDRNEAKGVPPSPRGAAADNSNNCVAGVADSPPKRRRGAPKGNKNALKHGRRTAEAVAHYAPVRAVLERARTLLALANGCVEIELARKRGDGGPQLAADQEAMLRMGRELL